MESAMDFTSPSQIPCLGGFALVRDTMFYSRVNEPKYKLIFWDLSQLFPPLLKNEEYVFVKHILFSMHM